MNAEELFHEALARPQVERHGFLAAACAGNEALRGRVEALLHAHENPGSFLAGQSLLPITSSDESISERPGTLIGPYKLMEQIGEGGMGLVFVAEQQHPVRRRVALKVIKPGMDTRQVIARFEAERQALALMDHPSIAKVHDGGETATGRPYFVMELVKGVPITEYCDQNQVPVRDRLKLFLEVCQAVQHAHQKGIIHRDIKPSNVLVMSNDGTPLVKVIDFGVAKAIGQELTEKTIYTQFAQFVGTPLYMSPEQAGHSGVDVDTRTDIYALGVLLYELLTGTTPFDKERLRTADYDELRRIIREDEPPKPSTRISTLGQAATTISTQRQSEPKRLSRLIRGELDWIVMKALEKDRNRRYETANAFAADVQRYLVDEPVQACPPSAWYRFGKVTRQHRRGLALSACVLAMVLGLASSGVWFAQQRAARLAEMERAVTAALAQAQVLLEEGDKQTENPERWLATVRLAQTALANAEKLLATTTPTRELAEQLQQIRAAVDGAITDSQLVIELERLRMVPALPNFYQGKRDELWLGDQYAKALAGYGIDLTDPEAAAARVRGCCIREVLLAALGDWRDKMVELEDKRWDSKVRSAVEQTPEAIRQRCRLALDQTDVAGLLRISNEPDLRDSALRRALKEWQQSPERLTQDRLDKILQAAEPDPSAFQVRWRAAVLRRDQAVLLRLADEPEAKSQTAADVVRMANNLRSFQTDEGRAAGRLLLLAAQERYPSDYWVNHTLGFNFSPKPEEAVGYLRAALAARSDSPQAHLYLASRLRDLGDLDGAIRHCQAAVRLEPNSAWGHDRLGFSLFVKGRFDEAIEALRVFLRIRGKDDPEGHHHLGCALEGKGLFDEAITEYREAIRLDPYYAWAPLDLAWLLATCPDPKLRDYPQAVESAKKGVQLAPKDPAGWRTLGVALYRAGPWPDAIAALKKSEELAPGRYFGLNAFFLAMAHWQLGEKEQAQTWYGRSVQWMEKNKPKDQELIRFRAEAAELLGITAKQD
jgi:serine/threonine protein kinase/tetratricopeptide (TPR) repeat protein